LFFLSISSRDHTYLLHFGQFKALRLPLEPTPLRYQRVSECSMHSCRYVLPAVEAMLLLVPLEDLACSQSLGLWRQISFNARSSGRAGTEGAVSHTYRSVSCHVYLYVCLFILSFPSGCQLDFLQTCCKAGNAKQISARGCSVLSHDRFVFFRKDIQPHGQRMQKQRQ